MSSCARIGARSVNCCSAALAAASSCRPRRLLTSSRATQAQPAPSAPSAGHQPLPVLAAAAINVAETVGQLLAPAGLRRRLPRFACSQIHRANTFEVGRVSVRLLGRIFQQPVPLRVDDSRQALLAMSWRSTSPSLTAVAAVASSFEIDDIRERGRDTAPPADRYPGRSRTWPPARHSRQRRPHARPNASQARTELTARTSRTTAKPAPILVPIVRSVKIDRAAVALTHGRVLRVEVRMSATGSGDCAPAPGGRCW